MLIELLKPAQVHEDLLMGNKIRVEVLNSDFIVIYDQVFKSQSELTVGTKGVVYFLEDKIVFEKKISHEDLKVAFDPIRQIYKNFIDNANYCSICVFLNYLENNNFFVHTNFLYSKRAKLLYSDDGQDISLTEEDKELLTKTCKEYLELYDFCVNQDFETFG